MPNRMLWFLRVQLASVTHPLLLQNFKQESGVTHRNATIGNPSLQIGLAPTGKQCIEMVEVVGIARALPRIHQ